MNTLETAYKLRSLKRSTIAIASVVLVEVTLGLIVSSLAIVSDGLHALLDTISMFILFFVTRLSIKPADEEHMYGHEKFESVGGLIGGLALIAVALLMVYEAILKIAQSGTVNLRIDYIGFIAIGYTFCIDFFRVGTFLRARKSKSSTMKAGLYHAAADLGSTLIAFAGFGLATLNIRTGDSLASIVLGALLTYLSVRLVWSSGLDLTDTIAKGLAEKVRKEVLSAENVCGFEDLKIRKAGDKTYVRARMQVPDYMSIEEAHNLASNVESKIKDVLGNADVTIHTEPCEMEMSTSRAVEKLATDVEGVVAVQEVNIAHEGNRLRVRLYAYVDPRLSVEEAQKMAERVEKEVEKNIENVEDVTVYMRPSASGKRRWAAADEAEVRKIVSAIAESHQRSFRVKGIVTYVAGGKRYINVNCGLIKRISDEETSRIVSQIEEQIRERFEKTSVSVRMEPA